MYVCLDVYVYRKISMCWCYFRVIKVEAISTMSPIKLLPRFKYIYTQTFICRIYLYVL